MGGRHEGNQSLCRHPCLCPESCELTDQVKVGKRRKEEALPLLFVHRMTHLCNRKTKRMMMVVISCISSLKQHECVNFMTSA